jgi:hypothetical protein
MATYNFIRSGDTYSLELDGQVKGLWSDPYDVDIDESETAFIISFKDPYYSCLINLAQDTVEVNGTPFSGTAQELRDELAGSVFTEGIAAVATYADLAAATASGLFKVTTDETNGGEQTFYLKDGNTIHWLVTQGV